ncbi:MAG: 3-dehydroquinate synthase [Methylacidiphilales bacterium]|nr:3-dehydroquinate synthase [Candidatus Methylacidiphilales bacterium]
MSERNIRVELGARAYSIHLGRGIVQKHLAPLLAKSEIAVLTDKTVQAQSWFAPLWDFIQKNADSSVLLTVEAGEPSKDLSVFSRLCSELARNNISRRGRLIAIGGGVIGDLGGFLAASYLRGIGLVQIPTTLLAAVDSSVGGKTGVNLPEGKNLVGAFYQPEQVLIDLDFLATLPGRELSAGMAEVVKHGVIRDPALFEVVKNGVPKELGGIIETSVRIKADVVAHDEREESGLRAILNFGHTIGHAIEQTAGYGRLLHGEAVSIGMIGAAWISHRHCGLDVKAVEALRLALQANKLPVQIEGLDYEKLAPVILRDKKSTNKTVKWVLVPEIGRTLLCPDVPENLVREAVEVCAGRQ